MSYFGLIMGFFVGFIVGRFWNTTNDIKSLKLDREKRKEEALAKIMELFNTNSEIANQDVESLLNVSDATATNYLNELEKRGLITQVGTEGRGVKYVKNG